MIKQTYFLATLAFCVASLQSNPLKAQADDFVIIVNSDVSESSLSSEELRRIYFGFSSKWSNDKTVKLSYTDSQSSDFWQFLLTSKSDYVQFWNKREILGNGTAPVTMKSSESVIDYVSNTKGAIGIIQSKLASEIGEDCKLIAISD